MVKARTFAKRAGTVSTYHKRQYEKMYESTRALLEFMEETAGDFSGARILDVACGAGANMLHMIRRWPAADITGVDLKQEAIEYARRHFPKKFLKKARFQRGDLFDLPNMFSRNAFDVVTFMQTLLLFDANTYPDVLERLFYVAQKWIFLSSLFTDFEMDVESRIRLHAPCDEYPSGTVSYNTFAVSRFENVCAKLGAKEIIWRDFQIRIDLPIPETRGLGTYTVRKADGERLQFSGCVYMPWKFVGIRLRG